MKMLIGIVVGLLLGTSLTAFAGSTWRNNYSIMSEETRSFRLGYVSGAFDMLGSAQGASRDWLNRQFKCLDDSRISNTLGELVDWAERNWMRETKRFNAASILLDNACE